MEELNKREREIFGFLKRFIAENGYPPSIREICAAVGLGSTSSVYAYLKALAAKGYISYKPKARRSISITSRAGQVRAVPLVGTVAAGVPIFAFDNIQEHIPIPQNMLHGAAEGEVFLLSVSGDSMINAGINSGDMVLVHSGLKPENGEIAVVRVQEEAATVKRIFYENSGVRLQPENPAVRPIVTNDFEVVGKVIGLLRRY